MGLVFAARLARRLGRIDDERRRVPRHVVFVIRPLAAPAHGHGRRELVSFMERDKKARHNLAFVLDGPEGVEVVRGVGVDDVVATLAEMEQRAGVGLLG